MPAAPWRYTTPDQAAAEEQRKQAAASQYDDLISSHFQAFGLPAPSLPSFAAQQPAAPPPAAPSGPTPWGSLQAKLGQLHQQPQPLPSSGGGSLWDKAKGLAGSAVGEVGEGLHLGMEALNAGQKQMTGALFAPFGNLEIDPATGKPKRFFDRHSVIDALTDPDKWNPDMSHQIALENAVRKQGGDQPTGSLWDTLRQEGNEVQGSNLPTGTKTAMSLLGTPSTYLLAGLGGTTSAAKLGGTIAGGAAGAGLGDQFGENNNLPMPLRVAATIGGGALGGMVGHDPFAALRNLRSDSPLMQRIAGIQKSPTGEPMLGLGTFDPGEGASAAERANLAKMLREGGTSEKELADMGLIDKPGAGRGASSPSTAPALSAKPAFEPKPFEIPSSPQNEAQSASALREALNFADKEHGLRLGENTVGAEIGEGRKAQVAAYRDTFQKALLSGDSEAQAADKALTAARGPMRQTFAEPIPTEQFPILEQHAAQEYAAGRISDYEHMQVAQDLRDLRAGAKQGLQPAEYTLWQKVFGAEVADRMATSISGKGPAWDVENPYPTMTLPGFETPATGVQPQMFNAEAGTTSLPEAGSTRAFQPLARESALRGEQPAPFVGDTAEAQSLAASRYNPNAPDLSFQDAALIGAVPANVSPEGWAAYWARTSERDKAAMRAGLDRMRAAGETGGAPLNLQNQYTTPPLGAPEPAVPQSPAGASLVRGEEQVPVGSTPEMQALAASRTNPEAGALVLRQPTLADLQTGTIAADLASPTSVVRSARQRLWTHIADVLNLPMALRSGVDFSGTLRQGLALGAGNLKEVPSALRAQVSSFASPQKYDAAITAIREHPFYGLLRESGLHLGSDAKGVLSGEEVLSSHLFANAPILNRFQKAYVGFLDTLRASVFYKEVENMVAAEARGGRVVDKSAIEQLADVINHGSGRGTGAALDTIGAFQVHPFFSPRNFVSKPQLIADMFMKDGVARQQAIRQVVGLGSVVVGADLLAGFAGQGVGINPLAGDFGRFKAGNTSFDLSGGLAGTLRTAGQVLTGKRSVGGKLQDANRLETLGRFGRGKLSPTASVITDLLKGKDYPGHVIDWGALTGNGSIGAELANLGVPITVGDIVNAAKSELGEGVTPQSALTFTAAAMGSILGAGTQSGILPSEALSDAAQHQTGTPYFDMEPSAQKAFREKPENAQLYQDFLNAAGPEFRQATAKRAQLSAQQEAANQALLSGQITPQEWQAQTHDRKTELRGAEGIIYADKRLVPPTDPAKFDDFIASGKTPLDKFYRAVDVFTGPDGQPDWDGQIADYKAHLSPADQAYIDRNSGLSQTPIEKLRSTLSNEYYALSPVYGFNSDEARTIAQVVAYGRALVPNAAAMTAAGIPVPRSQILAAIQRDKGGLARLLGRQPTEHEMAGVRRSIYGLLTSTGTRQRYAVAHPELALATGQTALTPDQVTAIQARLRA